MGLEKDGYGTDHVLLKGIQPGNVKVTLSIDEKGYTGVAPDELEIHVTKRFEIFPVSKEQYVLPYSSI